jgi:hypothetical protein
VDDVLRYPVLLKSVNTGSRWWAPYDRSASAECISVYADNNGRQWQANFVKMEEELEHDAEGNVIPLLHEDG